MYTAVSNLKHALTPYGDGQVAEELAVDGLVVQPADLGERVPYAIVSVKTNSILVTFDGTDPDPSGSVGLLYAEGIYYWSKQMVASAKMIEAVADTAGAIRIEPMGI